MQKKKVSLILIYKKDPTVAGQDMIFTDIMLNKGTTALPYEPYGYATKLELAGRNLFDAKNAPEYDANGITVKWLEDEQCFLLNGTSISNSAAGRFFVNIPANKGSTYGIINQYVSGTVSVPEGGYAVSYFGADGKIDASNNWLSVRCETNDTFKSRVCDYDYITCFWFYITTGVVLNNYKVRVMLCESSTELPYEPYKQPQTATLTSDRPLTKWDRLVHMDGQWMWEYMGKEIEFDGSKDEQVYVYSDNKENTYTFLVAINDKLIGEDNLIVDRLKKGRAPWVLDEAYIFSGHINNKYLYLNLNYSRNSI